MHKRISSSLRLFLCAVALFSIGGLCAAAPTRVAVVGDSITCGVGTSTPAWDSYPSQVQRMLGGDYLIGNFGDSGCTLLKHGDKPYQQQGAFRQAREFKPDIVVIMLGTNDAKPQNWKFKDQFLGDYKDLIRQFKEVPSKPRIYICRPPYISKQGSDFINAPSLLEQLPLIDAIAKDEGIGLIDAYGSIAEKDKLLPDGVHPNTAGATEIAKVVYAGLAGKPWEGTIPNELLSDWNGYQKRDFLLNGRTAILVAPKKALQGKPWIWRPQFFGAFPAVDIALLAEGYHVAYTDLQNSFGAPSAIKVMDGFYDYMTQTQGLAARVVLEGFSRGGLFSLNWAARNPGKVSALYLDAPVCDFNSWPGGKGKGKGSPVDWKCCLELYKLTEADALNSPLIPLNNLKAIAEAKIPIIAVAGDADDVVPMDENILILEKRYHDLGGLLELIVKPGVGHHPHSLTDPTPVVKFLLRNAIKPTAPQ